MVLGVRVPLLCVPVLPDLLGTDLVVLAQEAERKLGTLPFVAVIAAPVGCLDVRAILVGLDPAKAIDGRPDLEWIVV
jgi:hypothetical protein